MKQKRETQGGENLNLPEPNVVRRGNCCKLAPVGAQKNNTNLIKSLFLTV